MHPRFSLMPMLSLVIVMFAATSASAQSEWQALMEKLSRNAQKVQVAGVEFKGYKSAQTKFTKCNGDVIEIGAQTPKAAGPCPQDSNPAHILVFRAILMKLDGTILRIQAEDGKEYELYLPEEASQLVVEEEPNTSVAATAGPVGDAGVRIMSNANRNRVSFRVTDLKRNELRPREAITIVSFIDGRAEAIIKGQD